LSGFQIVSCQFALHYFFEHRQNLENVLKLVSRYLVPGGYFIGTTINGEKIRRLMDSKRVHTEKLFTITNEKAFKMNAYGNKYRFLINDSGDKGNYFNTTGVSTEYLVDFKQLTELCSQYGLFPVYENYFETYLDKEGYVKFAKTGSILEKTTKPPNVYDFTDILRRWKPKSEPLNEDERKLNDLYSAFVFVKK
jgi:mRNA (guanine-N7-)-methyltransferase